jgi:uracil-DNA glycosylase family 4
MAHTLLHLTIDYCKTLLLLGERTARVSPTVAQAWQHYIRNLTASSAALSPYSVEKPAAKKIQPIDETNLKTSPNNPAMPIKSNSVVLPQNPIVLEGNTKAEQLANLRAQVATCQICPHLASTRTQTVFSAGNPEARLMFIGEAPGKDEDEQGEPFVGAAGQLLTKMITAMGLTRDDVYIANVLKCRPDMPEGSSGNRKPTHDEMRHCLPYLLAQVQIIRPQLIVALGATAVEGLLGEKKVFMTKIRGQIMDFQGIPLIPTYHPAYLLYNQSITEKRKVWEDLLLAMEHLGLPISEKQRAYFSTLNKKP